MTTLTITIEDTDYERLVELAEKRGESNLSRLVGELVGELARRDSTASPGSESSKPNRWAEAARSHRERASLRGLSEEVNETIREFRDEFAV